MLKGSYKFWIQAMVEFPHLVGAETHHGFRFILRHYRLLISVEEVVYITIHVWMSHIVTHSLIQAEDR